MTEKLNQKAMLYSLLYNLQLLKDEPTSLDGSSVNNLNQVESNSVEPLNVIQISFK